MSTRYEEPKEGHYYQAVAKGRMSKLQELAVAPPPAPLRTWADDYCDWLLSPSGECIVSKKGRDAVEALRAKLKLTNVPVDAATRAVRDDEGAREVVRLCVDWDGRMARLRQLHKDFDTLRQPGLNPAALIWDKPPTHRGAARVISRSQMSCPRGAPCALSTPRPNASLGMTARRTLSTSPWGPSGSAAARSCSSPSRAVCTCQAG